MILIADANVLIDLGHVDLGLQTLIKIAPVEVLDVVLQECEHESQKGLIEQVTGSGVKVMESDPEWLYLLPADPKGKLSMQDKLIVYYAKNYQRTVLTGDEALRIICRDMDLQVHGTLWVIEEAFKASLLDAEKLCCWLDTLSAINPRLPKAEIERIRSNLQR